MYRLVTFVNDYSGRRQQERGPWLKSREEADYWQSQLRERGYVVRIESMSGTLPDSGGNALAQALSSMA
ncbi:hypothetical protein SAMN05660652_02879 [Propionivibrio dicarboxylicus]|uniref:Uncharacterized protein n=1 Tax=Propionivibrio dicarboxylicus TaxID=83767 RepID=A0A1G8HYP4_9RHOO|nr:hypothetical protein SAMN05660652_02879 [Propionivibrio dicarboxylicus]